jgi:hypothetical protein
VNNETSSVDLRESRPNDGRDQDASLGDALARLVGATEQVLVDQIDLTRLEVERALTRIRDDAEATVSRVVRGAALFGSAAALAVGGWFLLMAALILLLDQGLPRSASVAVVGGANLLLALAVVRAGIAATRPRPHAAPGD